MTGGGDESFTGGSLRGGFGRQVDVDVDAGAGRRTVRRPRAAARLHYTFTFVNHIHHYFDQLISFNSFNLITLKLKKKIIK